MGLMAQLFQNKKDFCLSGSRASVVGPSKVYALLFGVCVCVCGRERERGGGSSHGILPSRSGLMYRSCAYTPVENHVCAW